MPKMEFLCTAKPSLFAYPPALEDKKEEEMEKVETAVLSVKARKNEKEAAKQKQPVAAAGAVTTDAKDKSNILFSFWFLMVFRVSKLLKTICCNCVKVNFLISNIVFRYNCHQFC